MRVSLATKISFAIVGVLALAVLSSVVTIVSAYRFEAFQQMLVVENLESVRAAEELEIALLDQRGYVSSYILDGGNQAWLDQLDLRRQDFDRWLGRARDTARSPEEHEILDRLEVVHRAYSLKRDEVVKLHDDGEAEQAKLVLLGEVTRLYQEAYGECERFIEVNQRLVDEAIASVRSQVKGITLLVTGVLLITIGLGFTLLWLFFRGVLLPLRRIAADVREAAGTESSSEGDKLPDEMHELGRYVQLLMTNVAETRSDLEHSQAQLALADKLAAVGRLAASVAHEIRNPLTSIKMWLYSLRRSVPPGEEVKQKFDIVSGEISRLENIVRNFLEFARPPSLDLQKLSIGELIDQTLELIEPQLLDLQIECLREDEANLPWIVVDPEQMTQVFLNLFNNAMEAMPGGGRLCVSCSQSRHGGHSMIAVEVADTGTGISEEVQQRVFEPFFTTKEEGMGLGLCIAASVMARHQGVLKLKSSGEGGTRWTVWIPAVNSPVELIAGPMHEEHFG